MKISLTNTMRVAYISLCPKKFITALLFKLIKFGPMLVKHLNLNAILKFNRIAILKQRMRLRSTLKKFGLVRSHLMN